MCAECMYGGGGSFNRPGLRLHGLMSFAGRISMLCTPRRHACCCPDMPCRISPHGLPAPMAQMAALGGRRSPAPQRWRCHGVCVDTEGHTARRWRQGAHARGCKCIQRPAATAAAAQRALSKMCTAAHLMLHVCMKGEHPTLRMSPAHTAAGCRSPVMCTPVGAPVTADVCTTAGDVPLLAECEIGRHIRAVAGTCSSSTCQGAATQTRLAGCGQVHPTIAVAPFPVRCNSR